MPTDAWRRSAGGLGLLSIPSLGADYPQPNKHIIATHSPEAIGDALFGLSRVTFGNGTYPSANRALAFPFVIAHPFLVRKVFWVNGSPSGTDSADVAVYTEAGARLVSGGGTLITPSNATQEVNVTDTLLKPGRYWMAYAQSGVTATPMMNAAVAANLRAAGCAQMDTAYVLPATFTPAAVAAANIPVFGIASRTLAS